MRGRYANGNSQNSGNVITDRSSTRLHAPPGGRSSLSLGWGGGQADANADSRADTAFPFFRSSLFARNARRVVVVGVFDDDDADDDDRSERETFPFF